MSRPSGRVEGGSAMRTKRAVLSSAVGALALAGSLFLTSPANAAKSANWGCPPNYTAATAQDIYQNHNPSGATLAEIQAIDKNGHDGLCWKATPVSGTINKNTGPNVVDDNSSSNGG